ncbi:MAG: hypothetical protein LRY56_05580 [Burkholderiaceae bacterium]|nr:hypothetical protein [Burkholderiaceae bacterium]MCD8517412.1 hypothetical protein [Burkholderiaceae bacterium]MCD8536981.1 hypothetical protein [Burkholderiaceae bacterium]
MAQPAHIIALALAIMAAPLLPVHAQQAVESLQEQREAARQAKQDLQSRIAEVQKQLDKKKRRVSACF